MRQFIARWKASDQPGGSSGSPDLKSAVSNRVYSSDREARVKVTKALLVRLEAQPGKGDAVEDFLVWARLLVEKEPGTKPWLAVRFDASTFGIIDAFPDDEARQTHLAGPVGQELKEKAELFASPPQIVKLDVLADKL